MALITSPSLLQEYLLQLSCSGVANAPPPTGPSYDQRVGFFVRCASRRRSLFWDEVATMKEEA